MPLVAGHDERCARSDRAKGSNDELVRIFVRQEKAGALVKPMAMIIAGVIAVPPDPDVRVSDKAIKRDALERAIENVGHCNT